MISLLNGTTFRAIGFTDPLSVKADEAKLDFPTRVDWDQFFFSTNKRKMDEKEPGERPDTVYIGGLPFDWFQVQKSNQPELHILNNFFKFMDKNGFKSWNLIQFFKSSVDDNIEATFKRIFSQFGVVSCVDIPQCDPLRKQMESEISGILLSSWLFGQVQHVFLAFWLFWIRTLRIPFSRCTSNSSSTLDL